MNETKFNSELRTVLRAQGLGVLHIREADQPGAADLAIWQGRRLTWVELKIEDHEVEPHQWQFLEEQKNNGGMAFVVRLRGDCGVQIQEVMGHNHLVASERHPDYHRVRWLSIFQ